MGDVIFNTSLGKDHFNGSKLPEAARAERLMLHARRVHYGFPSITDIIGHWKNTYNVTIANITERDYGRNHHDEILDKIEELIRSGEFEGSISKKSLVNPLKREGTGNNYSVARATRAVNGAMPLIDPSIMKNGNSVDRAKQIEDLSYVNNLVSLQQKLMAGVRENVKLIHSLEGVKEAKLSTLVSRARTNKEKEEEKAREGFAKKKVDISDAEITDEMRIEFDDETE